MRGITTFIVMISLFSIGLIVGVPMLDGIVPVVQGMTPDKYTGTIGNIHAFSVKWSVPIFITTALLWAVFYILRTERQQVR